jgi:hypothetical protein
VLNLSRSTLCIIGASLTVAAALLSPAGAEAHPPPSVITAAATSVTARSAVLNGAVNPNDEQTTYSFEYGLSTGYGKLTPFVSAGRGKVYVSVSYALAGLTPNTTYHVRLGAGSKEGISHGADVSFTTAAEAGAGSAPPSGSGAPTSGSTPGLAPEAAPVLGQSVNVSETAGTVLVRVPGATSAVALSDVSSIPVGAIVDTRKGTVELETALPNAKMQTGTFHGGVFQVRQSAAGGGMTELVLRGPKPTCPTGGARAAATSKKSPPRNLWGSDHGGRFRTRGSNAVATVRGTSWFMADRCDGTYTRVKNGSVAVRELHSGRTVVLRAGQSHLARATR